MVGLVGLLVVAVGPSAPARGVAAAPAESAVALPPAEAVPPRSVRAGPRGAWRWPLSPAPAVLRAFEAPAQRWSPGHRGVDLAALPGAVVLAPAAGTVSFTGVVVDRGVLTLAHPGGLRSSFEPVTALVAAGAVVSAGQPVATVEPTARHCASTSCLHWGVRRGDVYLDPLRLLVPPPPSVLLPLEGHAGASGLGRRPSGWTARRIRAGPVRRR